MHHYYVWLVANALAESGSRVRRSPETFDQRSWRYPFSRRSRRRTIFHANDEKKNETNDSPLEPSQENKVDEEW